MSKFDNKKVILRYSIVSILLTCVAVSVVAKAFYIMTAKHEFWMAVADRTKRDSVIVKPIRGNILSDDGQLMASSLPEYKMFMDFQALHASNADTLWDEKLDTICQCLSQIFPEKSAQEFRRHLEEGRNQVQKNGNIGSRHWPIYKNRVDYNTFNQVKELPVFNLSKYTSGFHYEKNNARKLAYGSLAGRTIGEMYGAIDSAKCGLELYYDSILRGKDGYIHRRKVLNKYLDITDTPPIDGADIVTTIDVGIQDLAERAVVDELKLIDGNVGVAIVMEVATGDIKAIVNMERTANGYKEVRNHAVSDLLEPGSVFKTASIMVCLDEGKCDTTKMVDTGNGQWPMYNRVMKDHNWTRGGYKRISLPKTLQVSSNIGVSRIVDQYYHSHPEKFVEAIYRTGLADDLDIPLFGSTPARIRMPKKDKKGKKWVNWNETSLPWMSIGYETQIPPISMLTFYNAIANDGKMVKPRFVKQVVKDGEVVADYPVVVMREQIAKPSTIKTMQTILEQVVSQGLGKKAGSKSFKVAGKTGTAQISKGAAGYRSGTMQYLLSFAGFFPADNPRYSCIVCIQKSGLPASGGGMSGVVFHNIAEGIMAQDVKIDINDAKDKSSNPTPEVKSGNIMAADYVLEEIGFSTSFQGDTLDDNNEPVWGKAESKKSKSFDLIKQQQTASDCVPNVEGMGARDAVYLMESRGVKVLINGRGKVTRQSLQPGQKIKKGDICHLQLS